MKLQSDKVNLSVTLGCVLDCEVVSELKQIKLFLPSILLEKKGNAVLLHHIKCGVLVSVQLKSIKIVSF